MGKWYNMTCVTLPVHLVVMSKVHACQFKACMKVDWLPLCLNKIMFETLPILSGKCPIAECYFQHETSRSPPHHTSRGVYQTSRGVYQTSRGVYQTSRGVYQTSRGYTVPLPPFVWLEHWCILQTEYCCSVLIQLFPFQIEICVLFHFTYVACNSTVLVGCNFECFPTCTAVLLPGGKGMACTCTQLLLTICWDCADVRTDRAMASIAKNLFKSKCFSWSYIWSTWHCGVMLSSEVRIQVQYCPNG